MKDLPVRVIVQGQELKFPVYSPYYRNIDEYDNLIIKPTFSPQWANLDTYIDWATENLEDEYHPEKFDETFSIPISDLAGKKHLAFCFFGKDTDATQRITTNFLQMELR